MGLDILFTIGISSIVIATYQTFSEHKNRRKVEKSKFLFRGCYERGESREESVV